VSWLRRITLKTNISHPSKFILIYVPKVLPLLAFHQASIVTFLKTFPENISTPFLRVKQPKNKVFEISGCILKQYNRYLLRLYLMQVTLTMSETYSFVDVKAGNNLQEENINIALPEFRRFYFSCRHK